MTKPDDVSGNGGARRDRTDDLKLAKLPLSQLSYGPAETGVQGSAVPRLVGLGRLELPTSRLSSARSNQLSYRPYAFALFMRPRKRNVDGEVPPNWDVTCRPYIQ